MATLKPEQYEAIAMLALPKAVRPSLGEIADKVGVDASTLYRWRKDPAFQAEQKRESVAMSMDRMADVLEALADGAIEDRNAAAAKTYLQMHGMLTEKVEVDANVKGDSLDPAAILARAERFRASGNRADGDKDAS